MATSDSRSVVVCGRELRVDVRPGRVDGPPLLMCCGVGASFDVLDPLVEALDPDLTVVRFDVPGVGGSPTPLLPYTFWQLAHLSDAMMRTLGFDEYDVLGYSWGGGLAQQQAWQYRRRVRRLVLVCTGSGVLMVPGSPWILLRMMSPRRFRDPAYAERLAPDLYGGGARRHREQVSHLFRDLEQAGNARGYVYQLLAAAIWTSLPFLPTISQPTLVVSGDSDPIIPVANARILSTLIPRARLHLFHGGHIDPVIEPMTVAPQISEFLKEDR
jgi:poly(3-hydroxyalkanoate) depolymerase